ncbi:MAG: preprotein translocase subunit SecE [Lachnospiraceae bacterium]|nr:preprotein translocase subunit SecE [Lachnospiraceae bacterium]
MSDEKNNTGLKHWFEGLEIEWKKITWPDKDTLVRETITVTVVSVVLGIIIALVDMVLQYGINFLVK